MSGAKDKVGNLRLPKAGHERVIANDRYGNKIVLHGNATDLGSADFGYDLQTDGRVLLTRTLARKLSAWLLEFSRHGKLEGE